MELHWVVNLSASGLHAAGAVAGEAHAAPAALSAEVVRRAGRLNRLLDQEHVDPVAFYEHAVPLSVGIDDHKTLTLRVLSRLWGPDRVPQSTVNLLAEALREFHQAYRAAAPALLEEIETRSGPLREQWDARGPGLLASVGRQAGREMLVERADVLLVSPVLGGGGDAHLSYNSVRIEAVLANPIESLPEVVRLAWMLSLLNLDLPRHSENVPPARRGLVLRLAMIPAVLEAAADVELVRDPAAGIAAAIEAWLPDRTAPADAAERLSAWWAEFLAGDRRWNVALGALVQMMECE